MLATVATGLVAFVGTAPAHADDTRKLPIGQAVGLMTHWGEGSPDKCMEIGDGHPDTDTVVRQSTCVFQPLSNYLRPNQKWRLMPVPGLSPDVWGFYHVQLQNVQSGQCLTTDPNALGNGYDRILMTNCTGGLKTQQWLIELWANWWGHGWAFRMSNDQNGRTLQVDGHSTQNNASIVATYKGDDANMWAPVTEPPRSDRGCTVCWHHN
jgi:hypothetical protein